MSTPERSPGIVVLGAGCHAKLVIEYLELDGRKPVAVLDDSTAKHGTQVMGVPVIGAVSLLSSMKQEGRVRGVAIGFGNIRLRTKSAELCRWVSDMGLDMVKVVHPAAFISSSASCSPGLFLGPMAAVNTETTVGANVTIYTGSTIDHDSVIEDHVFISPGVHTAGQVHIETGAYIGPGAVIGSECRIGAGSIVGAGAVVLEDVPPGVLAAGMPARAIKTVEEWERDIR